VTSPSAPQPDRLHSPLITRPRLLDETLITTSQRSQQAHDSRQSMTRLANRPRASIRARRCGHRVRREPQHSRRGEQRGIRSTPHCWPRHSACPSHPQWPSWRRDDTSSSHRLPRQGSAECEACCRLRSSGRYRRWKRAVGQCHRPARTRADGTGRRRRTVCSIELTVQAQSTVATIRRRVKKELGEPVEFVMA
jgi:hypothetical protein